MPKVLPKNKKPLANRVEDMVNPNTTNGHTAQKTVEEQPPVENAPDPEAVQLRAYQIHLERGGSDLDNWFEAERQLKEELLRTKQPTVETIEKDELQEKMKSDGQLQIVNVLSPEHYHLGSIKGAIKIPLDELDRRMNELDPTKDVVTFCASYECTASSQAAAKLAAQGFKVRAYEGGIREWKQAGLPVQ